MECRGYAAPEICTALEGIEVDVELDGDQGDAATAASPSYSELCSDVQSPTTPHPGTMFPPPPPGEPPRLQRNKRPHGLAGAEQMTLDMSAGANGASSSTPCVASAPNSPAAAESTEPKEIGDDEPATNDADVSSSMLATASIAEPSDAQQLTASAQHTISTPSSPSSMDSSSSDEEGETEIDSLGPPPGPPPAELAPPPPPGPPPSLPLDRAELKRGVDHSESSPLGKRLRQDAEMIGVPDEIPSGGSCDGAEVDASYARAPPSARWVWDRCLQHDGNTASAAVLEKRMLRALDALNFGAESCPE